jgi:hypothetical protein
MNSRAWTSVFAALGVSVVGAQASAHIQLTCPPARYAYSATGIKMGPCGGTNGTKSNKVTHLIAGQQLSITFTETVYHPGFFRISLDTAGTEAFPAISKTPQNPVVAPVLSDNVLPHTSGSSNAKRTATITVPSTPCAKCVLQLTQFMSDNPNAGYYECADVVIDASSDGPDFSCGATGMGGKSGAGGKTGTGGNNGGGGGGGKGSGGTGEGGATGSGGVASTGSGGATSSGGASSSGGATSSGGASSSGGSSSGGASSSAGATSSGGITASGGSSSGGSSGSGGSSSNGSGGTSSNGSGGAKGETDDGAGGCAYIVGKTSTLALATSLVGLLLALRRRTRRASR